MSNSGAAITGRLAVCPAYGYGSVAYGKRDAVRIPQHGAGWAWVCSLSLSGAPRSASP